MREKKKKGEAKNRLEKTESNKSTWGEVLQKQTLPNEQHNKNRNGGRNKVK